jgi:S-methylmethionine-dependent homocysteine/selenocysteine methylase
MRFTGFFEAGGDVSTTVSYVETEDLLERLRARLEAVPPGTWVRIDLIAWEGATE